MASIPIPARAAAHPNLRPLNPLRDLPQVADLIELCFAGGMDRDGKDYIRQMRQAGQNHPWLRTMESASSMPLTGYVWEVDGRIVGNTSLIGFHHHKCKISMLANVAVHPDYRHQHIGRMLTEQAMRRAREQGADELWLNVRDDNPDAIDMYTDTGFRERARRTTWLAEGETAPNTVPGGFTIAARHPNFWPLQREWLAHLHPDELAWYRGWNFTSLAPGLWNWLYLLFVDINLQQWAVLRGNQLQAVLSWLPNGSRHEPLWLAVGPDSAPGAVTSLLIHVRNKMGQRKLVLEHPCGPLDEAIHAAGFHPERTLLWMSAEGATKQA